MSFITHDHNNTLMLDSLYTWDVNISSVILTDNVSSQRASSHLMQCLTCRLLMTLQTESYDNVTVVNNSTNVRVVCKKLSWLSISSIQIWQKSKSSIMLKLKCDSEGWTSSLWNKAQYLDNHNIGSQSADLHWNVTVAADHVTRPCKSIGYKWLHKQNFWIFFKFSLNLMLSSHLNLYFMHPMHSMHHTSKPFKLWSL